MAIPDLTHQTASNAIAAMGNWFAVFTNPAGVTGVNEAAGGSYVRRQGVWTPGSTGINTGSTVNIPVPSGTYKEAGVFSAQTAGTFVGSDAFADGDVMVQGVGASIDVTGVIQA